MDRRRFLSWALLASLGRAAGATRTLRAMAAAGRSAPGRLDVIGLQLYTVRRELEVDFEGTLARVAALGYREVELAGLHGRTPAQVRAVLDGVGLRAVSGHASFPALGREWPRHLDEAVTLGQRFIVCPSAPAEEFRSAATVGRLAELFNRTGEAARAAGLRFGYHNHDFEFAPVGGTSAFDLLVQRTDAAMVDFELDIYWARKAGRDPVHYFEHYPRRFRLVHVKDMDGTPQRGFTEVGRGVIDFRRILAAADRAGVRHYFVEQDETRGPALHSVAASYAYLRDLTW